MSLKPDLIQTNFKRIQIQFNLFQILIDPKKDLSELEKIETKYGCEGIEERNNFLHRNFYRSKMNFELIFWEIKVCF
jgi:hypothetical protein